MSSPTVRCKCGRLTNYGLTCVYCREPYSVSKAVGKDNDDDSLYDEFEEAGLEVTSLDELEED